MSEPSTTTSGSPTSGTRVRYMTAMVVDATGNGLYLPISLLYFHHVTGLPLTQVGAIMTSAALVGLLSNPVAGTLVDRYGARAVVVGGYLVRAAGFLVYPFVDSPVPMFLAVALVAVGDGSYPPSIQSFIAEITQGAGRDRLIAAQRSLRNAGLGVGGLLASAALALGNAAYQVIVLVSAAAFVAAAALIHSIGSARPAHGTGPRPRGGYQLVFRDRTFVKLTLANVPTAFGYMALSVSLPVYVTQELHHSTSVVGLLYAVNTVGIALLQIPVTRVLTRYRRTRAAALGISVLSLSFLLFAALGAAAGGQVALAGAFVGTALFTLGELMHGATASALVSNAAPEATRGRYMAVYQLSWSLPTALAPAVLTALLSLSAVALWLTLAAGAAVSALALVRLERRLPEHAVHPGTTAPAPRDRTVQA
ncbi:MFS transporter [Actinoplanes sp. NPDC051494]|uniref:MFS transporter n=1 Tax=Actinoplanes sp. NPDC051494 TaxID=3363907 RepID=UPI00379E5339